MSENTILNEIKNLNSTQDINNILDCSFKEFGRVLDNTPYTNLSKLLEKNTKITENNVYVASEIMLFDQLAYDDATTFFGGIDIQIGYCNGMNQTLNGMEYHKSPEIIVAGSDILLFLGKPSDLKDFSTFNQCDVKVFFAKKGSAFALNPEILHLSPCCVHKSGFKSAIILPKGTNLDLSKKESNLDKESQILFKNNKWMISHKDRKQLVSQGVKIGITGINSRLIPLND